MAVCHGNVMMGFRVRIERMDEKRYREIEHSDDPKDDIHNAHILHYSRRNPYTGEIADFPIFMRSICPWNFSLSSNEWAPIERPKYTSQQLLESINHFPQLVNNPPD